MSKPLNFTIERRSIPHREIKNYDRHIKQSEQINGQRLVLPQAQDNLQPRARLVSTVYTWVT